ADMIANTGSAGFNLPMEAVGQAKIRITATDAFGNVGEDVSDDFFTITCQPPEMPTVSAITASGAQVSWSPTGSGAGYDLLYGLEGFDPLTGGVLVEGLAETGFPLAGLMPATGYHCYVRTVCGSTPGDWSAPAQFTTLSGDEQTICIPDGWSIISSYKQPYNPAMEDVFAPLNVLNQVLIVLSQPGIYWPSQNINTIGDWNVYKGYKIKMNIAGCLHIAGDMPENKTVTAPEGFSYLPVLCEQPVPVDDIYQQLGSDLRLIFDLHTQQIFWPEGGIFNLQFLEPGKGYLLYVMTQSGITFNCGKSSPAGYAKAAPPAFEHAPWSVNNTGISHFIAIAGEALAAMEAGDFIGVFGREGSCAGLIRYAGQKDNLLLLAFGDDPATDETDGLLPGEPMTFSIFRAATGETVQVEAAFSAALPDSDLFTERGRSMITGLKAGATAVAEKGLHDVRLHPNPNDGRFTLELPATGHPVTIEMVSATGVLIHTETLPQSGNPRTHTLDKSKLQPG
ncbi:MAG: fibronectin type III domain-containing protein, partial [Chloroflexia bacterium]|nr:fibronectin type III domain-containing protein [Chloroflexia bacterium]